MVVPKFKVKVRNDSNVDVYTEVLLYKNNTYVDKAAGNISANSTRTFTIDYMPPASRDIIIDKWAIEVYAEGEYFSGRTIYTPKADITYKGGYGTIRIDSKIYLNDYYRINKSTFYLGFSLGYKGNYWDLPPVKFTYENGKLTAYSEGTGNLDYTYIYDDTITLSLEISYEGTYISVNYGNLYVKVSNDSISDIKRKLGLSGADWVDVYFALWHGYDGTYMRGCFYFKKDSIWTVIY